MPFDVWQINAAIQVLSPYAAGTWLMRVFAATPALAVAIVASATGLSASTLQAVPLQGYSTFSWHP